MAPVPSPAAREPGFGRQAAAVLSFVVRDDYPITAAEGPLYSQPVIIVPWPTGERPLAERNAAGRPRAVVVAGQPLFTEALAGLLSRPPLGAITRTIHRSDHALELLAETPANLVLCDVRIQPLPYRSFLAAVAELPSAPPVVLLADVEDQDLLVAEIDSCAAGLFTKDADPAQFIEGVRAALSGHRAVGANVIRRLLMRLEGADRAPPRPGLEQLSPTELDVLAMVGAASSVEQIAHARGISQKTVRNHLANIYRKLDLRSRTEAMLCAARMGLTAQGPADAPTRDKCPDRST